METTSRKYYEDKLREFSQYRRGRSLQQFCKDEGIDYKWMQRAKKEYAVKSTDPADAGGAEAASFIELHYDGAAACGSSSEPTPATHLAGYRQWRVGSVALSDPDGNEITVSSGSVAALGNLLIKLADCHD